MKQRIPGVALRAVIAAALVLSLVVWWSGSKARVRAQNAIFNGPTSAQPLALSADGTLLAVANPDNNSVSLFDVSFDRNRKLAEVPVGEEPNGVALSPNGSRLYVANTVTGTVSVFVVNRNAARTARFLTAVPVGAEPYAVVLTPNGKKLYVANARSNNISVIAT